MAVLLFGWSADSCPEMIAVFSACGTTRTFGDVRFRAAVRGEADIKRA